ncbi:MAG TPA: discoidin domain-containing protein [Thermoanaerobaculia bacterium]|nr:discoidin domain-containing protein [Thermoanaerobaculia bacterium]
MSFRAATAAIFMAVLAFGCGREKPAQSPSAVQKPFDADERANLLNLAYGASVVSRSAESMFDFAAIRAIDGDPASYWLSPPFDTRQTLVFSLPARSRIGSIGLQTADRPELAVRMARVAFSADGTAFSAPVDLRLQPTGALQLTRIAPIDASFVRVETVESGDKAAQLVGVHARGEQIEPREPRLDGCFEINGAPAAFRQTGARVSGAIGARDPILLEGGSDGRFFRFAWVRGPQYGFAAISTSPGDATLSGMLWHEEALPLFFRTAWQGQKSSCTTSVPSHDVMQHRLDRAGRFPLYGLAFTPEGVLDEQRSAESLDALVRVMRRERVRLISHEFRHDEARNLQLSRARLESLRSAIARRGVDVSAVAFDAAGSARSRQDPSTEVMRALYGCIEVEKVPPA